MSTPEEDLVRKAAELARLELGPEETAALARDFATLLEAFRTLQEVDVDGVPPMTGTAELSDVLRDDLQRPGLERSDVLACAPEPRDGFFGVPRVLGGEGQDAGERESAG